MGVNNLLTIGNNALFATQVAINVTGNNIANVNTYGYSRQSVRFEEFSPMNHNPGQLGMGAYAAEVYRNFNQFAEKAYLGRFSQQSRWEEQQASMQSVESLFNESNRSGLNSAMGIFFQDWQDLTQRPNDPATREALLSDSNNLARIMRSTQESMANMQKEMDLAIQQSVGEVNKILEGLRDINRQINQAKNPTNNPNGLYDKRDMMVRELAQYVDISIIDRGDGEIAINTKAGLPLLDGEAIFSLEVGSSRIEQRLVEGSGFTGQMHAVGSDAQEYTVEIVKGGTANDATFKVSLDGGRTWLRDDNGAILEIPMEGSNPDGSTRPIKVKDIEVSFTTSTGFTPGDTFDVMPKTGLYWNSPTRAPLNITPQTFLDGTENSNRLTGGKLTSYFTVRDQNIGKYMDRMDALAKSMIWEVNAAHSQGAGTTKLNGTLGSYGVNNTSRPLGQSSTGLAFADRLTAGNVNFTMYDRDGKPALTTQPLVFNPPAADGSTNFDPNVHSLEDVMNAINNLPGFQVSAGPPPTTGKMQATILEGQLSINAPAGASFALSSDTAGLMAGLGINTFFTGSGAGDIGIKNDVMQDPRLIASGAVNADGTVAEGDNATAKAIAKFATEGVKISTMWETTNQSMVNYHATLVSQVGSDMRTAKFNADYNRTLATELDERVASISGVSLDEEMTSLIKFQHSYTAAAKLITTADQMLQTLLSLKQ